MFDDDDELKNVCWNIDPASCCCAILFSNPCISRLIINCQSGLWGGGEPRAGLSVEAESGFLDCGESAKVREGEFEGEDEMHIAESPSSCG